MNLEKKEEEVRKTFDSMPRKLLDDFKEYPNMTEEILKLRYPDYYKRYATWEDVLDAFTLYFQDRDKDG